MFLQQHFHTDGTTTEAAPLQAEAVKPRFGRARNSDRIDARVAVLFAVLFSFAQGSDEDYVHMASKNSPNKNIPGLYPLTFISPQNYPHRFEVPR